MTTYLAASLEGAFGLDHLRLVQRPLPEPGVGQVRLRMSAASLNYRDLMMVRGHYNPRQPLPLIPCSDGVGVVEALGPGVSRVALGERVCPTFSQTWLGGELRREHLRQTLGGPLDGALAQVMICDAQGLVRPPEHLDDHEAAALPCAALTAWSALVEQAQLKPGQTVVIQGTGGVSLFALQLALTLGARVILTSSSDQKLERALALGAHHGINYRDCPRWGDEVGGAGTLEQSIKAVRPGGQICLIGVLTGASQPLHITPILMQNLRVQGVFVGHRDGFEAMNRAISHHKLRPVLDQIFTLEQARDAFERLEGAQHMGKIIISLAP